MGSAFAVCFMYWLGVSSLVWFVAYVCNVRITILQILSMMVRNQCNCFSLYVEETVFVTFCVAIFCSWVFKSQSAVQQIHTMGNYYGKSHWLFMTFKVTKHSKSGHGRSLTYLICSGEILKESTHYIMAEIYCRVIITYYAWLETITYLAYLDPERVKMKSI